jgi:hypothetical protein
MKQLFLIFALATASVAQAQKVDRSKVQADSVQKVTDTTALLTISDIQEFDALLQKKLTVAEFRTYQELFKFWQDRISQRVKEFEARQKKGGK